MTPPPGKTSDLPPEEDDAFDAAEAAPDEMGAVAPEDDAPQTPESVRRGVAVIKRYWKHAPNGPGVYRMIAESGEVLYVGKAKNVRKRVASYTRLAGHVNRIARMISATASMVFISVETETEALLLEANLIKQMKPRFNVLMRDDKSFPYILIARDHDAPQIAKHRGARVRKGDYFGPFASVWAVNRALNALERAFLLRSCSQSFYDNRTRPCLLYQIKRGDIVKMAIRKWQCLHAQIAAQNSLALVDTVVEVYAEQVRGLKWVPGRLATTEIQRNRVDFLVVDAELLVAGKVG